ncbi:glycosyltransferase family 2 protein [Bacillus pacificus]|uniref:glycosyltransferase family 2 protein n=1 Tax=Bacillus pacificus TaxID=2026187 RepID=UPI003D1A2551
MVESTTTISVVIPVYNAEKYLKKCLESLIAQSYVNWEAFIIDDASTDGSLEILSQFKEKDERIKIYHHDVNKGPGYTRNEAINYICENQKLSSSSESFIVFIDSDDWIEKEYFQSIIHVANKDKADVIFVDVVQENENGEFIKNENMSLYKGESKDTIIRHQMTGKLPWGGCRKSVRASLIIENDISYSNDAIGEEAIYSFKLLNKAQRIGFIEKALYHYVIHLDSQSHKYDDDPWGEICINMENYLKQNKMFDMYKNTLNSFAFTALVVSIYRITQYNNIRNAIKKSRIALKNYKNRYGFDMDEDSLEPRVKYILPFARLKMIIPILMIAKIKSMLK